MTHVCLYCIRTPLDGEGKTIICVRFLRGCVKGGKEVENKNKQKKGTERESASHLVMAAFEEPRLDERKIWK
jgi:hypothetical protein